MKTPRREAFGKLRAPAVGHICADGVLKSPADNLTVKPHLRLWSVVSSPGQARAAGHVEIEGLFPARFEDLHAEKTAAENVYEHALL